MRSNQIQKITSLFLVLIGMASSAANAANQSTAPTSTTQTGQATDSNSSKAIYGADSRIDYYNMSSTWQKAARSTVALISRTKLSRYGSDKVSISTKSYGFDNNLCSDERFYYQKTAAFCSGALVGPDLVMTAGHCIEDLVDCDNTNFVFDFANEYSWSDASTVAASKVYNCAKIISRTKTSTNDYALIQLDRTVKDRGYLLPASTGYSISTGTKLAVIGHPWGLPTKMADGVVTDDSPFYYFNANLDTYGGNSGSPVFNMNTGYIEGILVRGNDDFETAPGRSCQRSVVYAENTKDSEEVTRINQVASKIKSHNSTSTPAITCTISTPAQPVLYGATYKTSWFIKDFLPKDSKVSFYSYVNGKLVTNQYVNSADSLTETNNNQGADQTIERGIVAYDRFGNVICESGNVRFVVKGLESAKNTAVGSYITHLYGSIFGRQPDDSGFAFWYQQLSQNRLSCAQMPASFMSSSEFQVRNRTLDSTGFMNTLYQLVFRRAADAEGLQFWLNSLAKGESTRQGVINGFLASQEFDAQCRSYGLNGAGTFTMDKPVENLPDGLEARKATPIGSYITHLYSSILGRQPEDSGFTFWYDLAVQRKVSCAQLPASFLSSPEFQARNRQLNRSQYMTSLYQLVFQRDPDAQGLEFWLNSLNSGQSTRQTVIDGFLASPEFNNQCLSYGLDGAGQFTMDQPVENLPQ